MENSIFEICRTVLSNVVEGLLKRTERPGLGGEGGRLRGGCGRSMRTFEIVVYSTDGFGKVFVDLVVDVDE